MSGRTVITTTRKDVAKRAFAERRMPCEECGKQSYALWNRPDEPRRVWFALCEPCEAEMIKQAAEDRRRVGLT